MNATLIRHLAATVSFVVASGFFSALGCAQRADSPEPSGASQATLTTLLPPGERPFWAPIARAFETSRPGVRVELIEGPQSTDLRENLYTVALLARDPSLDLVYMDVTWVAKFAAAGWLAPLDEHFSDSLRAQFIPAALAAGIHRGTLYRIPARTDIGLLYYRSDWLEQAGLAPPETFEELTRAARALHSPPQRWGFAWPGKQYEGLVCCFLEILHGHGGYWIDPVGLEVGLDRPEALHALEFLVGTLADDPISPPGITTYQEEESRRLFQDGRAVFLRNWSYVWRLAQAEGSPVRGRVGARAMAAAPGGEPAGTLGGWGFGISSYSRQPELAADFIRFASSLESQRTLCAPTGYSPARVESYSDSLLLAGNPFLVEVLAAHSNAVIRPAIPAYALVSDILQRRVSGALSGAESPARALAIAARETRAALAGAAGADR